MGPAQLGILASGRSQVFTPLSLSPIAWYDSLSATMSATGDFWNDTMGNYSTTAAGGLRPTYVSSALNSRPGFSFDGSTDFLQTAARITQIQNISGLTIWAVMSRGIFAQADGTNNSISGIQHFTDDNFYVYACNGSLSYGFVATANAFKYVLLKFDGSLSGNANRLVFYINGAAQTLTFSGTIPATTENSGGSLFTIGEFNSSFNAGTICEIGIVPSAISGANITSLNSYLASKYAL